MFDFFFGRIRPSEAAKPNEPTKTQSGDYVSDEGGDVAFLWDADNCIYLLHLLMCMHYFFLSTHLSFMTSVVHNTYSGRRISSFLLSYL